MTPSDTPSEPWTWPEDWSSQATTDLAHHLEQAAAALRAGRAGVRRSATSWSSTGPNQLDVDLTWMPPD
ncbi:hypothetical protein [Pseudonocardia parietis]|uniref:Mycothiol maleylpyruvate isomerase-like protein n=1 Tax=Pseudonocardia parietis TaxID=570936 RepID=A0ABS4VLK0_9PSEU|nr:hypothetical protein [Pseudonocardia parietis]MBP2364780.1 hypothetical protein [Pseudonocardia parietis]